MLNDTIYKDLGIHEILGMPESEFAKLSAQTKWYYFYLIHYDFLSSETQFHMYRMSKNLQYHCKNVITIII